MIQVPEFYKYEKQLHLFNETDSEQMIKKIK